MIENFSTLVEAGDIEAREKIAEATRQTQGYLDAIWKAIA